MDNLEKTDWVWDFLSRYWRVLFQPQKEIPDVETDDSDDDDDKLNDYDN